jgi:hypothetical protein
MILNSNQSNEPGKPVIWGVNRTPAGLAGKLSDYMLPLWWTLSILPQNFQWQTILLVVLSQMLPEKSRSNTMIVDLGIT